MRKINTGLLSKLLLVGESRPLMCQRIPSSCGLLFHNPMLSLLLGHVPHLVPALLLHDACVQICYSRQHMGLDLIHDI